MPGEKVAPGQRVASSPLREAQTVNDLLDLLYRHKSGQLSGLGRTDQPPTLGTDFVMVRNDSGADRARGDVLQLGAYLLTVSDETTNKWNLWFAGDTPADPLWRCVILHEALPSEAIGIAHCSGVCVAKVDVSDINHTHAEPTDASNVLASAPTGPLEILSPVTGTGEQLLAVRFAEPLPLREGTLDADLTSAGTAAFTGDDGTAIPEVSTYLLTTGFKLSMGFHVIVARYQVDGTGLAWRVIACRECSVAE